MTQVKKANGEFEQFSEDKVLSSIRRAGIPKELQDNVLSEVKSKLYMKSRFEDLKDRFKFDEAWIVTNTKTTLDANTFAYCSGLKIISWNYPEGNSLRDMIERSTLHPITMLTRLSAAQKLKLLEDGIIICHDILDKPQVLDVIGLTHEEKKDTLSELEFICKSHTPKDSLHQD